MNKICHSYEVSIYRDNNNYEIIIILMIMMMYGNIFGDRDRVKRVISVAMYFQYAHHFCSRIPLKKWAKNGRESGSHRVDVDAWVGTVLYSQRR